MNNRRMEWPHEQDEILRILQVPPVSHFLQLSAVHLPTASG